MDAISASERNVSRPITDLGSTFTTFTTLMGFKRFLPGAAVEIRRPDGSLRDRHE